MIDDPPSGGHLLKIPFKSKGELFQFKHSVKKFYTICQIFLHRTLLKTYYQYLK